MESKDIWMTNKQFFKFWYMSIIGEESTKLSHGFFALINPYHDSDGCWYPILETWSLLVSDSGKLWHQKELVALQRMKYQILQQEIKQNLIPLEKCINVFY